MYYVGFSSATAVASLILFQGFHATHATDAVSLLCGFTVTFLGVHLLNLSRRTDSTADRAGHSALDGGLLNPHLNISGRMSLDGWNGVAEASAAVPPARRGHARGNSGSRFGNPSTTLFNAYEEGLEPTPAPESVVLHSLNEEESEEEESEEEVTDVDERTQLRKPPGPNSSHPQQNSFNHSRNNLHNHHQSQRQSAPRSHSSSPLPTPRTMGGNVRLN